MYLLETDLNRVFYVPLKSYEVQSSIIFHYVLLIPFFDKSEF